MNPPAHQPQPGFDFGNLLRTLRRRAGMTQADLAAAVAYSVSFISSLEKGARLPDAAILAERFVPALALQDEPALAARLVAAAAGARGQMAARAVTVTRTTAVYVEDEVGPAAPPLPALPTATIGRESDVDLICKRMAGHQGRLLSLLGPPGVGKTRLALEVAHRLAPIYADGARFVELAPVEQANQVPAALALALGLDPGREEPAVQIVAHLRRKELLLVLDNLEHVLGCAPFIKHLLEECTHVHIIATARERLHLRAEQRYKVAPLEPDAAVALFGERAAAMEPDFTATKENRATVAAICQALDCLPLAIELCAAHVSVLGLPALLAQLHDRRLDMLADGPSDLPQRHRTLANAIHRSYQLLPPAERDLLNRLAVFAGGFEEDAVHALGFDTAALRALDDKHLVRQVTSGDAPARYSLLETIREYALDRLIVAGDEATARRNHARFYLELAERIEGTPTVHGAIDLARLARELDNLRVALRFWIDAGANEAVRLAAALRPFWYERGHLREGRAWLAQALAADTTPCTARGYALLSAGQLAHNQGDNADALHLLAQAEQMFVQLADARGQAAVLNELAWVYFDTHDNAASIAAFEACIAQVRGFDEPAWLAALLSSTAMVLGYSDRSDARIRAYFSEATALHAAVENVGGQATALMQLALVEGLDGAYEEASRLAEKALDLLAPVAQLRDLAWAYEVTGETRWYCGNLPGAAEAYAEALALFEELGMREGVMLATHHLAQIDRRRDQPHAAAAGYLASLRQCAELEDIRMIGRCLAGLGAAALALGDAEAAARLLGAAMQRIESVPPFLAPCDAAEYATFRTDVAQALPAGRLDAAWAQGQELSLDELVSLAETVVTTQPHPPAGDQ
ncbi:MAG: helix-turn-helix domain-containing protein [Caldilinea sp.]|nr:helix-turn-helix domain-containing protein [Caldilinea sp.]